MDFNIQIKNLLDKHLENNVRVVGYAVLSLQRMIVDGTHGLPGTPYDTNAAASNWFVDVDTANYRVSDDTTRRNLGMANALIATAIGQSNPPNYFSLHNSLPYIKTLEYGLYPNPPKKGTGKTINGFSTQAPQGFFRIALQKWEKLVIETYQQNGGDGRRRI
ncbi:hypothetical protein [Alysiella crassa]|uniref:Uncharacterized protein n=1 Tax=Alysiella crassa TaxID=153491 RepID=A0A376BXH5_9NEIS|nr:hypothetical protein [Alysiella crassa]UOP06510.1 hypothetical protein LVJ80_12240 [Alysiella crassa]SSY81044.1 Uncharacterised protein [Alysiella crassa]